MLVSESCIWLFVACCTKIETNIVLLNYSFINFFVKFFLYIIYLLNNIHAQIALPSFHGAQKPHSNTSSAPIKVAVVSDVSNSGSGGRSATVLQLNDDTYYDFEATGLDVDEVDSALELANYDVVIIGGTGNGSNGGYTTTFYSALNTWRKTGKGILSTAWFVFESRSLTSNVDVQESTPYVENGRYGAMTKAQGTVTILDSEHNVTDGISDFSITSNYLEFPGSYSLDTGAERLGSTSSSTNACSICVHDHGSNGKTGYLGGQYMSNPNSYNTSNMRDGTEDKLLEQMVNWLAN